MRVFQKKMIDTVLMNADIASTGLPLDYMVGVGVQAVWTGTAGGSIKLQGSNDGVNWADVPDTTVTVSGAGGTLWNVRDVFYSWIRCSFANTGGAGMTGHLNVLANCKGA